MSQIPVTVFAEVFCDECGGELTTKVVFSSVSSCQEMILSIRPCQICLQKEWESGRACGYDQRDEKV